MTKVYTIGVSGPSCSGKTTLSQILFSILPNCVVICQDEFFKPDNQIPIDQTTGLANWDCPDAIDFKALTRTISHVRTNNGQLPEWYQSKAIKNDHDKRQILPRQVTQQLDPWLKHIQPDIMFLIVEGFMLYQDKDLSNEIDRKIFITASYEMLKTRRETRTGYATKLGTWVDPLGYFDDIVWPQYVKWNKQFFVDDSCSIVRQDVAHSMLVLNTDVSSIEQTSSKALDYLQTQFK
ncbi:P-loop containing nucleoside triphosphate hydrolase protein [Phycomyces blakesleeanus]|uniref:Phosphoribulokinase/uridine kinase domain-containing protein n=2 Tax=Phycomyces blakesleeanus TaxID=4837 RepID=A0A162V8A4_PHYB8|nr:hypothetical protein PHYBLDRAFT_138354 [Phycomyces blakesleeanus NRRL 1555(-)]OAD80803.1 hypothetical protein PHYBLDRAFT_138354 [Phycomyces blakesleeanus NRRL 1555(-)]|eukprot:XP_018298843.1 hypothetical protein PHYBLDRAFT_138354 [Phycomyces blakesleeanus NRRL 1555(-)]